MEELSNGEIYQMKKPPSFSGITAIIEPVKSIKIKVLHMELGLPYGNGINVKYKH